MHSILQNTKSTFYKSHIRNCVMANNMAAGELLITTFFDFDFGLHAGGRAHFGHRRF